MQRVCVCTDGSEIVYCLMFGTVVFPSRCLSRILCSNWHDSHEWVCKMYIASLHYTWKTCIWFALDLVYLHEHGSVFELYSCLFFYFGHLAFWIVFFVAFCIYGTDNNNKPTNETQQRTKIGTTFSRFILGHVFFR